MELVGNLHQTRQLGLGLQRQLGILGWSYHKLSPRWGKVRTRSLDQQGTLLGTERIGITELYRKSLRHPSGQEASPGEAYKRTDSQR